MDKFKDYNELLSKIMPTIENYNQRATKQLKIIKGDSKSYVVMDILFENEKEELITVLLQQEKYSVRYQHSDTANVPRGEPSKDINEIISIIINLLTTQCYGRLEYNLK